MQPTKLILEGLDQMDLIELEEALGQKIKAIDHVPQSKAQHNYPDLITVAISLTPSLISLLAVFLAKNRKVEADEEWVHVEVKPDHSLVLDTRTLKRSSSSETPDAKTINAVTGGIGEAMKQLNSLSGSEHTGAAS